MPSLSDYGKMMEIQSKASMKLAHDNARAWMDKYHTWFVTAGFILVPAFLLLGMWKSLLVSAMWLHLHLFIRENNRLIKQLFPKPPEKSDE